MCWCEAKFCFTEGSSQKTGGGGGGGEGGVMRKSLVCTGDPASRLIVGLLHCANSRPPNNTINYTLCSWAGNGSGYWS